MGIIILAYLLHQQNILLFMERNRAAATVTSYGLDTALHGAARYEKNIKLSHDILSSFGHVESYLLVGAEA